MRRLLIIALAAAPSRIASASGTSSLDAISIIKGLIGLDACYGAFGMDRVAR